MPKSISVWIYICSYKQVLCFSLEGRGLPIPVLTQALGICFAESYTQAQ